VGKTGLPERADEYSPTHQPDATPPKGDDEPGRKRYQVERSSIVLGRRRATQLAKCTFWRQVRRLPCISCRPC